ncbi:MAG: bacteriohemerythrin [Nitrospinae bacterium]|nr:bacteriohemerythrin [Nitrospinota bacterium]
MKLSRKLVVGFVVVASITAVTGGIGLFGLTRATGNLEAVGGANLPSVHRLLTVANGQAGAVAAMRSLAVSEMDINGRNAQYETLNNNLQKADNAIKAFETSPKSKEQARAWNEFMPAWNQWAAEVKNSLAISRNIDELGVDQPGRVKLAVMSAIVVHDDLYEGFTTALTRKSAPKVLLDESKSEFAAWVGAYKPADPKLAGSIASAVGQRKLAFEKAVRTNDLLVSGKYTEARDALAEFRDVSKGANAQLLSIYAKADEADTLFGQLRESVFGKVAPLFSSSNRLLEEISSSSMAETRTVFSETSAEGMMARSVMISAIIMSVFIAIGIGLWLARSTTGPIGGIVNNLSESSGILSNISSQISTASMSLAEAAGEQAAALEQTSSSLEQISAMTKQNADNADNASRLSQGMTAVARKGNQAIRKMIEEMKATNKASGEIATIIKVIEDIAFQTNLLALNAAVEAARAGEHGKGFAVVAEEVRNLAQRSAAAARDTTGLIEDTMKRAAEGGQSAQHADAVLGEIIESVEKVANLVTEIAEASKEQAEGVEQLSVAVAEMNKITQSNADSAQRIASSSEEMNEQARVSSEAVKGMFGIVYGNDLRTAAQLLLNNGNGNSFEWDPDLLAIDVPSMDGQHKKLFSMMSDLNNAIINGGGEAARKGLDSLIDYAKKHLAEEESLMKRYNYPDFTGHKAIHDRILEKVHSLYDQVKQGNEGVMIDIMMFLKDWLYNHIQKVDKRYGQHINQEDYRTTAPRRALIERTAA